MNGCSFTKHVLNIHWNGAPTVLYKSFIHVDFSLFVTHVWHPHSPSFDGIKKYLTWSDSPTSWLLHGWYHAKLLPCWCMLCLHHITRHFTVSFEATEKKTKQRRSWKKKVFSFAHMYQPDEDMALKGLPAWLHFHMRCPLQLRHLHSIFIGAQFTAKWYGLMNSGEDSSHDPAGDSGFWGCFFLAPRPAKTELKQAVNGGWLQASSLVWFWFQHTHACHWLQFCGVQRQKPFQRVFAYKFQFYHAFMFLTICPDITTQCALSPEWISKLFTQRTQWRYLITKLLICFYLLWYHEESEWRCWSYHGLSDITISKVSTQSWLISWHHRLLPEMPILPWVPSVCECRALAQQPIWGKQPHL